MKYPLKRLGDYIEILSGYAFKSKDFCESGIPVIKIKNITPPNVSLIDLSFVPQEVAEANKKFELNYNDVLIALTGSHINQMTSVVGRVARVKYNEKTMLNQRVAKIYALDEKECNIDYVYQYLSQDSVKIALASKAGGAANQANISPSDVKNLIVPFPNIKVQNRIADILSAYDNLIENNQKQIKLLEEAAQRLYKEWFVDLHFPGHENTKIVDGVPDGWRKGQARDFYEITIGKTPPRVESQWFTKDNRGIPWVSISDMGASNAYIFDTSEGLTKEAIQNHNVKVIPSGTILLSFKLTVGRVSITSTEMCTNEAIAHFRICNETLREYTFCYLKDFHYDSLGSTSSISKAVNSKIIKSMPFVLPCEDILISFSKITKPLFDSIYTKQKEIINLKEARDRLLPKLMSGELEV